MSNYDEIIHEITKYIKSKFTINLKEPSDLRKLECNILCEIMKIANDVEQELIDEAGNGYNGRTLKINNFRLPDLGRINSFFSDNQMAHF